MNAPDNAPYERRFPNPEQWPSRVVFGLYAEVVTEKTVNQMSWEWAGHQVADEVSAFLRAQGAREERQRAALDAGYVQGEPGE